MNDNVVEFTGITNLDMPAERPLSQALKADLESAVVVGYTKEGEFYFASSIAAGPEVLWLLELARQNLMRSSMETIPT